MESKKIVIGNLKMNFLAQEITAYLKKLEKMDCGKRVILCPSTIYLPYFVGKNFELGIQNISAFESGAYTGEVSAQQAKSIRVHYCLVGHSERRIHFQETDEMIREKIRQALKEKLKVVLCVGETETEKDELKTYKVLKKQIRTALRSFSGKELSDVIIAYEPVWAIGTGKVPSNTEISYTIGFIKAIVKELFDVEVAVLYGGSITEKNIAQLNKIENVDGFLVGSTSLNADKFKKIIEVVVTQ